MKKGVNSGFIFSVISYQEKQKELQPSRQVKENEYIPYLLKMILHKAVPGQIVLGLLLDSAMIESLYNATIDF